MSLESENTSDFERKNTIGKPLNSVPAQEENDTTHENWNLYWKLSKNAISEASIIHMGNAHAIAWHRRCGTGTPKPLFSV